MMKALRYLLVKEFKQMFRNRILPIIFVVLPIAMINVVPRIATQEVSNLNIAVCDADGSPLSHRMIEKVGASTRFNLQALCDDYSAAEEMIKRGSADMVLCIERGFERDMYRTGTGRVMITANAVGGMKGGLGSSYLSQILVQMTNELREEAGVQSHLPLSITPRYLYNPSADYVPYMIPALLAMMLILIVGFLPALNIVGERERGTIEQINVTPVGRVEFILSKMIPYWTVGMFIVTFSMLLAWKIHDVAPAGRIVDVIVFCFVFIFIISSMGLIVSNHSDNMRQAAMVMFFFIIIFILTSGLLSPLSAMPDWAFELTRINPARYVIAAIRDIYLKGSNLAQLVPQLLPLCAFAITMSVWAVVSFKKSN